MRALEQLVDIEAVRAGVRDQLSKRVDRTIGSGSGTVLGWIREGVRQIGDRAIDVAIDLNWVYGTLRTRNHDAETADPSLLSDTTYAFYESYDRFLVRLGELGESPIHVRLRLKNWRWQVSGIYD
jgi:hypothetical protein